jgi:monoamine oxidase
MERRKFIKTTLIGLPFIFASESLFATLNNENKTLNPCNKTVVIVGAGISGLIAAKKLKNLGFTVIVLEAQNKVGGRLKTDYSLGFAFDEGASWIHGITGNPITSLAQDAGMTTAFTDDESIIAYDLDGTEISKTLFSATENKFYNMINTLSNKGNITQSFETIFKKLYPQHTNNRLWKFFLSTYLTFDIGDLNLLSSLNYNEGKNFGGEERISKNGFEKIANYIASGINVQLNQRVSEINYTEKTVIITHNQTTTKADYVIVTVPLGVLKANTIRFNPSIPAKKTNAIKNIEMNCVNKFILTWDSSFWDTEQYIVYTPEIRDKFNYFLNVKKIHPNVNALITFAYSDYGRHTESMTDKAIIEEIMIHLRAIYGQNIPNPTNMKRTKWHTNINSYGSYSYTAIGTQMENYDTIAENINDKVFFAGEHTHSDYFSTVHGAYLSGLREADKIIALCTVLSSNDGIKKTDGVSIFLISENNLLKFSETISNYAIIDNEGKVVLSSQLKIDSINISSLNKGNYFVSFVDKKGNLNIQKFKNR